MLATWLGFSLSLSLLNVSLLLIFIGVSVLIGSTREARDTSYSYTLGDLFTLKSSLAATHMKKKKGYEVVETYRLFIVY